MDKTTHGRGLNPLTINTTINSFLGNLFPEGIPCARRLGNAAHHPQPAYKEKHHEKRTTQQVHARHY